MGRHLAARPCPFWEVHKKWGKKFDPLYWTTPGILLVLSAHLRLERERERGVRGAYDGDYSRANLDRLIDGLLVGGPIAGCESSGGAEVAARWARVTVRNISGV